MNFEIGHIIDGRFEVEGICSNQGGMGQILFVKDNTNEIADKIVLKYCKSDDPSLIRRFKKEVNIIDEFLGNAKVLNSLYSNTKFEPPYFVMKYYRQGDLTNIVELLKDDKDLQENAKVVRFNCQTQ